MKNEFVNFALQKGVLKFGEFITKAGRKSPYFFNAGLFEDGESLGKFANFYAKTALSCGIHFDGLFGPAYKGIVLASAVSVALAQLGKNCGFTYNRKESKDHGEGGNLVGAPLRGNILIVDDVISAGTSVRESVELIRQAGATPVGVLIALDRMERGKDKKLAIQEVFENYGIPVVSIVSLLDIINFLARNAQNAPKIAHINAYLKQYGEIQ